MTHCKAIIFVMLLWDVWMSRMPRQIAKARYSCSQAEWLTSLKCRDSWPGEILRSGLVPRTQGGQLIDIRHQCGALCEQSAGLPLAGYYSRGDPSFCATARTNSSSRVSSFRL